MIKVHNDGKEKSQSFEAILELEGVEYTSYGATEVEARSELNNYINKLIKELMSMTSATEETYRLNGTDSYFSLNAAKTILDNFTKYYAIKAEEKK